MYSAKSYYEITSTNLLNIVIFAHFVKMSVKLNFRYFIRNGVTSIIFTEVTLKLYYVEVVDITDNIQYLRMKYASNFFITSKMSIFKPTKQHMRETLLLCFN